MTDDDGRNTRIRSLVPHLAVSDVARTAEYYRDVLGFEIDGYWDGEAVHHDASRNALFGIVKRDNVRIHFNRGEGTRTSERSVGAYDLYFDVTDVLALAEELRNRGAEIVEGPTERVYEQRELVVRDCNDFVLAFGEPMYHGS